MTFILNDLGQLVRVQIRGMIGGSTAWIAIQCVQYQRRGEGWGAEGTSIYRAPTVYRHITKWFGVWLYNQRGLALGSTSKCKFPRSEMATMKVPYPTFSGRCQNSIGSQSVLVTRTVATSQSVLTYCEVNLMLPILQIGKLRPKEVSYLVQYLPSG